ncbi:MAG TPA: MFS transporter [Burkholderiaceae bacterium]|nr:MFS transporter [Burkholderiaceae bacterium]
MIDSSRRPSAMPNAAGPARPRPVPVRWAMLAGLFGFSFFAYVERASIGVAADRMMSDLDLSQVQVGWLFTAFLASYAALQAPGGWVGQRFGARLTLVACSILGLTATVTTVAAPALFVGTAAFIVLLLSQLLLGAAQAPVFPATAGATESWFPRRQWSFAQGLLSGGLNLGSAATPPAIAYLMVAMSWQAAMLLTSTPLVALTLFWYARARDLPADHPRVSREELEELEPAKTSSAFPSAKRVGALLVDRSLLLLTMSYLVMNYVFYFLTFWSFLYFRQERHFSTIDSGWLAAAPFIAAGAGAALGGGACDALRKRLGERWGFRAAPLLALPVSGLALVAAANARDAISAELALCSAFAAIEVTEGIYWAAAMRIAGSDSMLATGILNTGGNVGGIIGTPVVAMLTATHSWNAAFLTGSACAVFAALLWFGVDPLPKRRSR